MNASRTPASDIVVIGTGIAGLATALALSRKGQKVGLLGPQAKLEPSKPDEFDPRVYAISPASQRFLADLGIWDLIPTSRLAAVQAMEVFGDAAGYAAEQGSLPTPPPGRPGRVELSAWQGGTEALAWIVEAGEIERALRQAVQMFGISWTVDSFTGLERHADGPPIALHTRHHGAQRCYLAVGADGAQSPLREAAGLPMTRSEYDAIGLVVHLGCELPHQGRARQWFTPDGVLALLPMPDAAGEPQVSMVWSMRRAQAEALLAATPDEQHAELLERLSIATGAALGTMCIRSQLLGFPLALQTCPQIVGPGVALVGDAAHLVHPLAGQGLNLGLGDARTLAETVAARESFRTPHDVRVLRRYQRARAEALLAMRVTTDGLYRLFETQAAPIAWLRNTGMNVVNSLPFLKRLLINGASGM
jgi:ubiquinone biosynthesis UbiH/UbiF/VisC/COQ6 family hydroxylase